MSMFTFSTLYSGFPLVTVFFIAAVCKMHKSPYSMQPTDVLISTVLPIIIFIFFAYNIYPAHFTRSSSLPTFMLRIISVTGYAVKIE